MGIAKSLINAIYQHSQQAFRLCIPNNLEIAVHRNIAMKSLKYNLCHYVAIILIICQNYFESRENSENSIYNYYIGPPFWPPVKHLLDLKQGKKAAFVWLKMRVKIGDFCNLWSLTTAFDLASEMAAKLSPTKFTA